LAAGTLNSDEARDFDLPLKDRFFIQPLAPAQAAVRAKESAKEIVGVKELIDKKAWPYVQNDLRSKASYLRYDLKTVISAKPSGEKKSLKDLTEKLFSVIDNVSSKVWLFLQLMCFFVSLLAYSLFSLFDQQLDHAAKIKSTPEAEKYYAETVSALNDVLAKLG
jgi:photosystem II oxygen-evolving enhancer protein 3